MTAIAYRDGVLAGDTLCGYGSIKAHEKKIVKKDGYLLGMCGDDMPSIEAVTRWFFNEIKVARKSEFKNADFEILVVTPKGRIEVWNNFGLCQPIKLKFWAVGSGRACCMSAMEMGATAAQAVECAIKWDPHCGGRAHTLRLK